MRLEASMMRESGLWHLPLPELLMLLLTVIEPVIWDTFEAHNQMVV